MYAKVGENLERQASNDMDRALSGSMIPAVVRTVDQPASGGDSREVENGEIPAVTGICEVRSAGLEPTTF